MADFFYTLEVGDALGNRLRVEKVPLERPKPKEVDEAGIHEEKDIWIDDF